VRTKTRSSEKLAVNGYRVIRFWNDDVLLRLDDVLDESSRNVLTPPQPSPASRGGSITPEA
jgi:very-short-patch-repair endonuclease